MHALAPRALRAAAGIGEEKAAQAAHVGRGLLRTYEACREHVKSPAKRWLLDRFYESLAAHLAGCEQRGGFVLDGKFPDADDVATPEQALSAAA